MFDNATGTLTYMGDGITSKLDSWYPYRPRPYSGNPAVAGSSPADGSNKQDADLPNEPIIGRIRIECHETFKTYLMFKPPGSGSRYVPLRKVAWNWGGASLPLTDGKTSPIRKELLIPKELNVPTTRNGRRI